jgi:hypothetical protein
VRKRGRRCDADEKGGNFEGKQLERDSTDEKRGMEDPREKKAWNMEPIPLDSIWNNRYVL